MEALATRQDIHHRVPQCLLRLHDRAHAGGLDGEGIEMWLEYEHEAMRYGVNPEITRVDLAALVDSSTVPLLCGEHRRLHEADFARWGRRRGLATLQRYGRGWFVALALRRWGKVSPASLELVQTQCVKEDG